MEMHLNSKQQQKKCTLRKFYLLKKEMVLFSFGNTYWKSVSSVLRGLKILTVENPDYLNNECMFVQPGNEILVCWVDFYVARHFISDNF